jgi:hypothetical protein
MPDPTQSHFDRFLRPILASRFFTISAVVHLLIILLFGGTVLFNKYVEPPDFQSTGDTSVSTDTSAAPPPPPPDSTLPPTATDPSTNAPPPLPAPSMTALATMNPTATSFQVPMPAMAPPTIGQELTQPNQSDNTSTAVSLPGAMAGRGSGREGTGQKYGERAPAELAVMRALRWLQSQQHSDGTWGSGGFHDAFTGLALLCFLGHGDTPLSHEFGAVVTNGLNALITEGNARQAHFSGKDNFDDQPAAYQHGICTYALCEAYTMTKDPRLEPLVRQAVDYIIKGQRSDGGWAYQYDTGPDDPKSKKDPIKSDTSVSGWQIQALKAAHLTGLSGMDDVIPTLNNAMKNLDRVFDPKDGSFGYRKAGDSGTGHHLTGVGVLAKLFWLGRPDRTVREGLKNIESGQLSYQAPECNLYAWYYDTQACFQAQGSAWDWWNGRFQDLLTSQQSADGSWPPTGGNKENFHNTNDAGGDGPIYRTTLCCLMLEVFYRYLPTSQSDALGTSAVQGL